MTKRFAMTQEQGTSILQHLIRGADLSRYGLHSAITRTAEDLPDYDDATAFEAAGGTIIDLPQAEWRQLATAA